MAKEKESKLKPWQFYSDQIDWNKVNAAISDVSTPLSDLEEELVRICVWDAAEKYVSLDLAAFKITGIEKRVEFQPEGSKSIVKGYIDLMGEIREDGIKPYCDYFPGIWEADWKTTGGRVFSTDNKDGSGPQFSGTVNSQWKERYLDSWQGKIYARAAGARLMEYRGISQLREYASLILAFEEHQIQEVDEYVVGASAIYNSLLDSGLQVWPRRMPKSCGNWGRDCQFKKNQDCILYTMPKGVPPRRDLSFSSIEQLYECPEKFRRMSLDKGLDDGTDASRFGEAVHRGIASSHSQLTGVPIEESKSSLELDKKEEE